MKTIAIYNKSDKNIVYVRGLSICYKKAMIDSSFELNLVDANGEYVNTIHFGHLNEYSIGELEYRILMQEMDKMVRENAKLIYDEYGKVKGSK